MQVDMNTKQASYQEANTAIQNLMGLGGAVMTPLILHKCFREEFPEYIDDLDTIRAITETFCAIRNEYHLVASRQKEEIRGFYAPRNLNEKYFISAQLWHSCIVILGNANFIHYGYRNNDFGENSDIFYSFDFDKLEYLKKKATEIRDKQRTTASWKNIKSSSKKHS